MARFLSIFLIFIAAAASGQRTSQHSIPVDGLTRNYLVYRPAEGGPAARHAAIFLFHGGKGTPRSILEMNPGHDFRAIADKNGVMLIVPEGVGKSWNDGRKTKANRQHIDDVKFISLLLDKVLSDYAVDPNRVYATGISNGGFMVSRLGCELGNRFAAIACVSATMGTNAPFNSCSPVAPIPVLYIHGTADRIVRFNGGSRTLGARSAYVSHKDVIAKWVKANGCDPEPVITRLPDTARDGTSAIRYVYRSGRSRSEVVSYVIENGGHTWPGGTQYLPKAIVGTVSHQLDACDVIWGFFQSHPKS